MSVVGLLVIRPMSQMGPKTEVEKHTALVCSNLEADIRQLLAYLARRAIEQR
jgi:hypothetical protein